MKVIKEAINNLPEVEEKGIAALDPVMAQAKIENDENEKEFSEVEPGAEKLDRKGDYAFGAEDQPKPEEAEKELEKITLDESLFEEDFDSIEEYIDQDMENGNAFMIMGYTANAMQECGLTDEIGEMRTRAMSSNYENLMTVCQEYIDRCNEIHDDIDDEMDIDDSSNISELMQFEESYTQDELQELKDNYLGKKIRINFMINPDSDIDDSKYNGAEGIVEEIDDLGQLHGSWGGLAVIPEVDDFEIIADDTEDFEV